MAAMAQQIRRTHEHEKQIRRNIIYKFDHILQHYYPGWLMHVDFDPKEHLVWKEETQNDFKLISIDIDIKIEAGPYAFSSKFAYHFQREMVPRLRTYFDSVFPESLKTLQVHYDNPELNKIEAYEYDNMKYAQTISYQIKKIVNQRYTFLPHEHFFLLSDKPGGESWEDFELDFAEAVLTSGNIQV